MHALGDYGKPGPSSLVVRDGKHTPHPTDVASCVDSRLVVVHETKRGASFDASKVKLLSGGDKLTARFMRQDYFVFEPTHTLIMLSNYKPQVDATDAALWRRVQLVPFEVVIPEDEQDRDLADKIKRAEAPGVLRWIVQGALQWKEHGLQPPDIVREQTEAYRAAEDAIGQFIEECCVRNKAAKAKAGSLYAKFKEWSESQGDHPVRGNDFAAELIGRGFRHVRERDGRMYYGIGLHAAEYEDAGR
jgi:putative DNA primase/helicase